jgi:hypothetical protein
MVKAIIRVFNLSIRRLTTVFRLNSPRCNSPINRGSTFFHKSWFIALLLLVPLSGFAQITGDEIPRATDEILLKNIQYKSEAGAEIQRADIYISDGIIVEIGEDLSHIQSARIVEGGSLFAYAAFISALSHFGQPEEEDEARRSAWRGAPGSTPPEKSGITPHRLAADEFEAKSSEIKKYQKQGFAIIHTVPRGFVMTGKGSLVLNMDETHKDKLILTEQTGLFAQFRNKSRVYPATPLATMAIWRELLTDAKHQSQYYRLWGDNPQGLKRPQYTEVQKSLFPVAANDQAVFFHAAENKQILRAQQLSEELDFELVLSNVSNLSPDLMEKLNEEVQLISSLALPEKPEEEKEEDKEGEEEKDEEGEPESEEEEEKELPAGMTQVEYDYLKEQRKNAWEDRMTISARALERGILSGFSTLDTKDGDILKNIRALADHGMSEDDLLHALTTLPAEMFGLASVAGKIEKGYQAHLVIFDKPFTEEKAEVIYMIADGNLQKVKK